MGTTQILGIILGLTLVSSQLLNGFSVASTPAAEIPVWDFGFVQVQMIGYQGQVIAAIMAGFVLVYLEKFFKKYCPEVISMIVVPFCSIVPAVIIAHTVVGPIGWKIGDALANIVYSGLFSQFGWMFAGIFGLLYAPVVMTGLHHMTNAIDTQLVNTYNGTILWPMIALSNIAQGSSVLAMSVLQKKNERAQQINVPACISCYLGVTEPALFGVNLKYGFPLICGDDRFLHCGNGFSRIWDRSAECGRWRDSGNPFDQTEVLSDLFTGNGNCNCSSICFDIAHRKKKTLHEREGSL